MGGGRPHSGFIHKKVRPSRTVKSSGEGVKVTRGEGKDMVSKRPPVRIRFELGMGSTEALLSLFHRNSNREVLNFAHHTDAKNNAKIYQITHLSIKDNGVSLALESGTRRKLPASLRRCYGGLRSPSRMRHFDGPIDWNPH